MPMYDTSAAPTIEIAREIVIRIESDRTFEKAAVFSAFLVATAVAVVLVAPPLSSSAVGDLENDE